MIPKLNLQKSNPGCGLAIVEGNDNNSAREVFMRPEEMGKNSAQPVGNKAEKCDMQASAGLKIIGVRAITEPHERLLLKPHHGVKKFNIPLPTFIEIVDDNPDVNFPDHNSHKG